MRKPRYNNTKATSDTAASGTMSISGNSRPVTAWIRNVAGSELGFVTNHAVIASGSVRSTGALFQSCPRGFAQGASRSGASFIVSTWPNPVLTFVARMRG